MTELAILLPRAQIDFDPGQTPAEAALLAMRSDVVIVSGTRPEGEIGFERVELESGTFRQVSVTADPRLLARFDGGAARWHIAAGSYRIAVGKAADDLVLSG